MEPILGVSGWSYDEGVGPLYYEEQMKFKDNAKLFNSSGVNSTFYRFTATGLILNLCRSSKSGFILADKMPKLITQDKRMRLHPEGEG